MKRLIGPQIILLLFVLHLTPQSHADSPVDWAESLEAQLSGYAKEDHLSFVLLVAVGDDIVFHRAYGEANRKQRIRLEPGTAFDIGSISKTFTAAAIYKLAAEGKIDLEQTLGDYFAQAPSDKEGITVHQVLNHTAGLAGYHDRKGDFEVMTREKALERIFAGELQHPPGTKYAYSNAGYTLLALLVEQRSGQTFRDYLRKEFFEPLDLRSTGFYGDGELWRESGVATGYGDSREGKNSPATWRADSLWAVVGNGGIVSSAEDLLRWAHAQSRFFPDPAPPSGLGARREFVDGRFMARTEATGLQLFHGGAVDTGFISMLRTYPEHDMSLVILSNTYKAKKPHVRTHLAAIEATIFHEGHREAD